MKNFSLCWKFRFDMIKVVKESIFEFVFDKDMS